MKRTLIALCFFSVALSVYGVSNGADSGNAPNLPPPTATPTITSVSPATFIVSTLNQTITVTGTNFLGGLTLTVTPPSGSPLIISGPQIYLRTDTSFQVMITLAAAGNYTFQVTNPPTQQSNALSVTVRAGVQPWIPEGVRLTDVTAGFPGAPIANVSAFQLRDGRWRLLIGAGGAIRSAISPDGLSLTMEPGIRAANGDCGHVRAVRLDDGRVRVYCHNANGIVSFISVDEGVTLTPENGVRIPNSAVGVSSLDTGGIVRTRDGRWRMYFSDTSQGSGLPPPMRIFSASSSDMLNWSVDPGVRIGFGATASGTATHPSAVTNPDGSISVFYTRFVLPMPAVWVATSSDGLTFTSDVSTNLAPGADPDIVKVGSGYRVYYNWGDDTGGTIYSAFSANGPSQSDCLFNWAESSYSNLFAPMGALSNTLAPYYYRYYPQTNAYLGTSSADNHVYYLGSAGSILDAGALSGWLSTAGCQ